MLRSIVENGALGLTLAGLAFTALGWLWLVVVAFRERLGWGLAMLFPPSALVFVPRHWKRARWPLGLIVLGLVVTSIPPAVGYLTPIDLGPRERMVDGQRHLTLTGWDRHDYAILGSKSDVVVLQMANPDVVDSTLEHLRGLTALRELDLSDSKITDDGLTILADLPALERLRVANTSITDAGFRARLLGKPSLRQLDLRGTSVSAESIDEWKGAEPGRRALTGPRPALKASASAPAPAGGMP